MFTCATASPPLLCFLSNKRSCGPFSLLYFMFPGHTELQRQLCTTCWNDQLISWHFPYLMHALSKCLGSPGTLWLLELPGRNDIWINRDIPTPCLPLVFGDHSSFGQQGLNWDNKEAAQCFKKSLDFSANQNSKSGSPDYQLCDLRQVINFFKPTFPFHQQNRAKNSICHKVEVRYCV